MSSRSEIYMDYAAATPLDPLVLKAMRPFWSGHFYNPSATYQAARHVRHELDRGRAKVAHWLGSKPAEIIFTAGATEANNLALAGVMERFAGSNALVSAIEHASILEPASHYEYNLVPVDKAGMVKVDELARLVNDKTVLVSVIYASNEIGTIQPLSKISRVLDLIRRERQRAGNRLPLYLHTDASQAPSYLDLHVARLGVDLMSLNGGKIYGPKQSGALFVSSRVEFEPQILGGGQERGRRSGTENVAGSIGLASALELAQTNRRQESMRLRTMQQLFFKLLREHINGIVINGSLKHRLPNNVHVTIPGADNERLIMALDERGVMAAAGSACSAMNQSVRGSAHAALSTVVNAIGLDEAAARSSLRFTMGKSTTEAEVKRVVDLLSELVKPLA